MRKYLEQVASSVLDRLLPVEQEAVKSEREVLSQKSLGDLEFDLIPSAGSHKQDAHAALLIGVLVDRALEQGKTPNQAFTEYCLDTVIGRCTPNIYMKLKLAGVTTEPRHFLVAAEAGNIPVLEAMLPFVTGVNIVGPRQENAGHIAAGCNSGGGCCEAVDLDLFEFLDKNGLDKEALSETNLPSYAHVLAHHAGYWTWINELDIEFANFLADHNYPIDKKGPDGKTPADVAFETLGDTGIAVGMIYLKAGAEAKPEHLVNAIKTASRSPGQVETVLNLIDLFDERKVLDQKTARDALNEVYNQLECNEGSSKNLIPIARAITDKAFSASDRIAPALSRSSCPTRPPALPEEFRPSDFKPID